MLTLLGGWVPVTLLDNANERVRFLEESEKQARAQAEAALVGLDGFVRAGKFEVDAGLYDDLSDDAQEKVRTRLAKRVDDAVRSAGLLREATKKAAAKKAAAR
jgi:hypothetical protein